MNQTQENQEIICIVSKEIISKIANEELFLFDEYYLDYENNFPKYGKQKKVFIDDPLAFGIEESIFEVSPIVITFISAVLPYMVSLIIDIFGTLTKDQLTAKILEFFMDTEKNPNLLSPNQLKQIRKIAISSIKKFDIDGIKAEQIADSMIGNLAIKVRLHE